ncbi:hypothetical protein LR48_Vigan01g096300 [Vigna angularis]|uniref:Uncharacterized protein n=1 Tax=Phaseolus angularis TaxID=3914 RepID=A0A0L9TLD9_PHAAN|nr:hypothetical protein LR48_Vigan01g096300 [Vigna angularis]
MVSNQTTFTMEIETVASEAKVLPPKPKFEALKPHEMSDGQIQFRKRLIWWWLSTALSSVRQHEVVVLEEGERGAFPIHRNVAVGHPHHCASPPARTPKQYEFSPTLLNPAVNIPFGDETIISSSDLSTERGSAAEEWKDKTHTTRMLMIQQLMLVVDRVENALPSKIIRSITCYYSWKRIFVNIFMLTAIHN